MSSFKKYVCDGRLVLCLILQMMFKIVNMFEICRVLIEIKEECCDFQVYSEEKIWEKMEELRKVVGYSVVRSVMYVEELKVFYVFIGVVEFFQLSLMNQDSYDIVNVCVRFCFFMFVIGINQFDGVFVCQGQIFLSFEYVICSKF